MLDQWGRVVERRAYPEWPDTNQAVSELYSYDYVNNVIGYTDPDRNLNEDNLTTEYFYDSLNRVTRVKDALNQISEIGYSTLGDIESIDMRTNEGSQPVNIYNKTYDELKHLKTKTDPLQQNEEYKYNKLGLNTEMTDRNGNVYSYYYDNQRQRIYNFAEDSSGIETSKYAYYYKNPMGVTQVNEYGAGDSLLGYMIYSYGADSQITRKQAFYSGDQYQTNLYNTYDKANKLASTSTGKDSTGGFYTNLIYDKTRLSKVQTNGDLAQDSTGQAYVTYEYYPDGKIKNVIYPRLSDNSVLTTSYEYDGINRLTRLTNKKGDAVLSDFSYTFDDNGNIETVTDTNGTTSYIYDELNRLTEIDRPDSSIVRYTYDLKGNRQTVEENNPIIDTDNVSYEYDVRNQLTAVTKGTTTTTIKYLSDGLRYKKSTPEKTVMYHYNLDGKVSAESDGTGNITADYVWGPDKVLAKKDVQSGDTYYYLFNGHGDVIQVIDSSSQVVNNYVYDEWGNILSQNEGIDNPFKYAGEIYDSETGLYYLRARYYDPTIGRFISEDSYEGKITNPLSLNVYGYCQGNPIIYSDPTGNGPQLHEFPSQPSWLEWLWNTIIGKTQESWGEFKENFYAEHPGSKEAAEISQKLSAVCSFTEVFGAFEIVNEVNTALNLSKVITPTAGNLVNTEIPATFQIKIGERTLWANATGTQHMGEYIGRFGAQSWTIKMRSEYMLESFHSAVNEAMKSWGNLPPGEHFGKFGDWELGINTETGVLYHALLR